MAKFNLSTNILVLFAFLGNISLAATIRNALQLAAEIPKQTLNVSLIRIRLSFLGSQR